MLPSIKEIYASFASITFVGPSFDKLYEDMKNLESFNSIQDQGILSVKKNIVLKNIHYSYPNSSRTTLKDFNLTIPAKSTVGLIGTTGSGKTTTVDIILGLFEPQKGVLEVDDQIITQQNAKSWQRSIGYVPQNIFLSDDTVSANIVLGGKT